MNAEKNRRNMLVDYYVFSGTGNTLKIAGHIAERLKELGAEVRLRKMEDGFSPREKGCVAGIAFPVAFFSTYPLVLDFIDSLPRGDGAGVFLTCTMAGVTFGLEGRFREKFIAKGWRPLGAAAFKMPGNYNDDITPAAKYEKLVKDSLAQARTFADALHQGQASWGRGLPLIPALCESFVRGGRAMKFFNKHFPLSVDESVCINCGRCLGLCPVGAVTQTGRHPRIDLLKCQCCQRCAGFCPVHAIYVQGKHKAQYRAMDFEDFTN